MPDRRKTDANFGDRLRLARMAAGLALGDVAAALKISKQGISHWETGRSDPSIENVKRVIDLYHVKNPEWLLMGRGTLQSAMGPQVIGEPRSEPLTREDLKQQLADYVTTLKALGIRIGRITIMPAGTIQIDTLEATQNNTPAPKNKSAD
jgi:transcriptional regulator with XRE-family HTH domain